MYRGQEESKPKFFHRGIPLFHRQDPSAVLQNAPGLPELSQGRLIIEERKPKDVTRRL